MISIIGGSGFIGSSLCNLLEDSGELFEIIDKKISSSFPNRTKIADVRNPKEIENAIEGSILINLAAEHRDDVTPKSLYDEVNVEGARVVCQIAESKGINKIIFTSSVAVYGFAKIGIDETGDINYFNDYGRTKYEAEIVYKRWYERDPSNRSLIIIRPTVVFGERNRGNVYNLFKQVASGKFVMIGNGLNRKSLAYIQNVVSFLKFSLEFSNGFYLYNYVDKPDLDMNSLVDKINFSLGKSSEIKFRLPYFFGYSAGKIIDFAAFITGKKFSISSIRVKKFCSDTAYNTSLDNTGFVRPYTLEKGIENTIKYEFLDKIEGDLFFTE
jgi:GlcNAc-P-P-Und epimerase